MMTRRGFTFIELLAICVIVGLISALVMPRVGGSSKRMATEQALSTLNGAFSQTAMRARASGQSLMMVLNPEERRLTIQQLENSLSRDWQPPSLVGKSSSETEGDDDDEFHAANTGILAGENEYELSQDIEWIDLPDFEEEQNGVVFRFYPDGGASGPDLSFTLKDVDYLLELDAVTGRVTISELRD